ncbi:hypothetical protein C0416_00545 [bacterium]|nr:hypothetical protein [bacterium]
MKNDFTKLEKALRGLEKPLLSSESRENMRRDMLLRMNDSTPAELKYPSLERVKEYIKKVARITEPSPVFKASVKENVLAFVERKRLGSNFIWGMARSWQKVLATFMVGIISLSSFTVYFADIPVARAEKMTAFQDIYGNVEVLREGKSIEATKYMQLLEGDIVVTGENGLAVIRYFDDSVSRLSPFTELKMQRLYQDKKIKAKTKVEIELMNGRVWNQVVNLVDEQASFEVSVNNVKARTSEKASFDISSKESNNKVSVAVFENKVEVSVPEKRKENKQVVVEGYSVEVVENGSMENKIVLNSKEDELWVQVNKAEDKQYKMVVDKEKEEESKKEAGVLPADALYSAKKINESTKLLVTTDKTEKNKVKVDIAIKRLAEASALLSDGDKEGAMAPLDDFAKIVDEISYEVEGSEELRDYVRSAFADKEKDLSTVLPDGNRYMAKEALRDARLKLAVTDEEKNEVSLKSATEKVVEAKELFEDEKQEHAQVTLLEAAQEIVTVSSDENVIVDQKTLDQQQQTLSTVRVLKGAVEDKEDIKVEVQMIIDATEEALENPVEVLPEMDSAVVITIDEEPKVQLQEGQE